MNPQSKKSCLYAALIIVLLALALITPFILKESADAASLNRASDGCSQAQGIVAALNHYAKDHGGRYPEGQSSTEVFQQLLDGAYLDDPGIFSTYPPLDHKVKALHSPLRPENVSFDFTSGADATSPDTLPLVFTTGYKVTYLADGQVVPFPKQWFNGRSIGFCTKGGNPQGRPITAAHCFLPADFDPKGQTFRQLTPDGELSP